MNLGQFFKFAVLMVAFILFGVQASIIDLGKKDRIEGYYVDHVFKNVENVCQNTSTVHNLELDNVY